MQSRTSGVLKARARRLVVNHVFIKYHHLPRLRRVLLLGGGEISSLQILQLIIKFEPRNFPSFFFKGGVPRVLGVGWLKL